MHWRTRIIVFVDFAYKIERDFASAPAYINLLTNLPTSTFVIGKFINISMGQGQEKPAEGIVER